MGLKKGMKAYWFKVRKKPDTTIKVFARNWDDAWMRAAERLGVSGAKLVVSKRRAVKK